MVTPSRSFTPRLRGSCPRGFTLIELLTVIAVIAILLSITVGVSSYVSGAQARAKARGEIQALASALESFKAHYGDYPRLGTDVTSNGAELFRLLSGRAKMEVSGNNIVITGNTNPPAYRSFIDEEKFTIQGTGNNQTLVDPWGSDYRYAYAPAGTRESARDAGWERGGFILYSPGQDRDSDIDSLGSGALDDLSQDDLGVDSADDIIYGLEQ